MRSFVIIILLISAGLLNGCKKSVLAGTETSLNIQLNDCATTIFSDNGLQLCFDSILEDSRCPTNAFCIWQGSAICHFSFKKNNKTYPIVLSTLSLTGSYSKDTTVSGYKIEFIDLLPYPVLHPVPVPGNETKAEVKITKL
jgi:hypothetical protein